MKLTITLDRDVATRLAALRKKYPGRLRNLINDALRVGLGECVPPARSHEAFQTRAVSLGRCRLDNLDNIAEVLAFGEGEDFK